MTDTWTVEVEGVDFASKWFRTRSGTLIRIVEPAFVKGGRRVIAGMQEGYQSRGNASSYVRTGTYGRKFQQRLSKTINRITVNVYNLTPYAKWVGVKSTQAYVHRGRWPTDVDILKREGPKITEAVTGALIRGLH